MRPSTLIALTALFFSPAGNALAVRALMTSSDIKDGTIQLRDVAPNARAAQGQQGPAGGIAVRAQGGEAARGTMLFVRQATATGPSRYVVYRADLLSRTCRRLVAVPSGDRIYPRPWPDGRHVVTQAVAPGAPTAVVDTRDGSRKRISTGQVGLLTWSRDGRTLAFIDGGRARFVNVAGQAVKSFVPHPLTPWSPDGRRVAFTRTTGDGRAGTLRTVLIVAPVSDLSRGKVVYVEPNPYGESPDAVWSADGKTLYFLRAGKGMALRLATGKLGRTTMHFSQVIWTADGTRALFTATGPFGADDVFVMNRDGSEVRRLTATTLPKRGIPQAGSTAAGWSPDGEWIAYARRWGLAIMRSDGTGKQLICRTPVGVEPGNTAWTYAGS
jgi:hypothetical protein